MVSYRKLMVKLPFIYVFIIIYVVFIYFLVCIYDTFDIYDIIHVFIITYLVFIYVLVYIYDTLLPTYQVTVIRGSYPALGHLSFSNFFELLIAQIKKKKITD